MVDLWFADNSAKVKHDCSICVKNPQTARDRRCQEPAFDNLKKPRRIDDYSLMYSFCAGKATWFDEMAALFQDCRTALETGILPREGALEDQSEEFVEAFPAFIERWRERSYQRMWKDTHDFTSKVLEAVFGKKGK